MTPSRPALPDALLDPPLPEIRSMGVQLFDPVWSERAHASPDHCEMLHVVRGSMELVMGRKRFHAGAGDTLLVPRGRKHRDAFEHDTELEVFLVSFAWDVEEEFFARVDNDALARMDAPTRLELGRVVDLLRTDRGEGETDPVLARARLLNALLLALRSAVGAPPPEEEEYGARRRRELMLRAEEYMEEHYAEEITLDKIAAALCVSPYYLSHVFSAESDFSLFAYLTRLRMEKARALLAEGTRNVSEVARDTGYETAGYFSKVFRKHFGRPPREYIRTSRARKTRKD